MKKPGRESRGKKSPRKQKTAAREKSSQPAVEKSPASSEPSPKTSASVFPIVGIGASAGGLEAFTQLLKHLPSDTGMGFVLVQHLDPDHESALAQILARVTSMPVREVANELRIAPNHVYIIPPNTDMATARGVLKLQRRQAGRAPHHSIDFFFESPIASLAIPGRDQSVFKTAHRQRQLSGAEDGAGRFDAAIAGRHQEGKGGKQSRSQGRRARRSERRDADGER